ncbi:MAG TPA: hypothetical protein VFC63_18155, partial [Blastocatellia bacterium]|nr:hypothetical protein [Blastocatellia bacterium]
EGGVRPHSLRCGLLSRINPSGALSRVLDRVLASAMDQLRGADAPLFKQVKLLPLLNCMQFQW